MSAAAEAHFMKESTEMDREVLYKWPSATKGRCRRITRTLNMALSASVVNLSGWGRVSLKAEDVGWLETIFLRLDWAELQMRRQCLLPSLKSRL